jgi:hypothetical protein
MDTTCLRPRRLANNAMGALVAWGCELLAAGCE